MTESTPPVRMKGVGNSLWLTVAADSPLEAIQAELVKLFAPLKHMAHSTRVVLDTGTSSTDERFQRIHTYLKEAFDLKEIVAPEEKAKDEEYRVKMRSADNIITRHSSETLVLSGRVRSGQSVIAKKHLIIMGDVNPGCDLVAGGDILVIGSLLGTASAGQPDNADAIILALDFRPTQVKIGGVVAAGMPAKGQGGFEYAHLEDGAIVVDDYVAANPFKRMPWPVLR
ncbi:putative septum site-determining protein MinC [Desulfosarcina cetonica]|uniref:septum site-determining protein MinC n=1 Tax=Desulfosarcina cetonica TaxID=90730 RepID=UPI0012ECF06D|nr:septum site-determining protein MinC [Desulfosarcina cetonica]VTR69667.1 putative septum site-determining protein MinC [Desulfosarcina cetonica]